MNPEKITTASYPIIPFIGEVPDSAEQSEGVSGFCDNLAGLIKPLLDPRFIIDKFEIKLSRVPLGLLVKGIDTGKNFNVYNFQFSEAGQIISSDPEYIEEVHDRKSEAITGIVKAIQGALANQEFEEILIRWDLMQNLGHINKVYSRFLYIDVLNKNCKLRKTYYQQNIPLP